MHSRLLRLALLILIILPLEACSLIGRQEPTSEKLSKSVSETHTVPAPASLTQSPSPVLTSPTAEIAPPQPTLSLTPSPTPLPALIQLTSDGCCVEPFWSPDGSQVLFLDKPSPDSPAGFYGVAPGGGASTLYTDRLGLYSPDMRLLAYPQNGQTLVERLSDGQYWTIPNEGRAISFSPKGTQVAWTEGNAGPPFDTPLRKVWVSAFDGTGNRQVAQVFGGGFSGWLSEDRILVSGKMDASEPLPSLWGVSLEDGSTSSLATGERLRGVSLSPRGSWLAYQRVFDPDPAQNGIWLVNTTNGAALKLELFGGYRWQDDRHLLLIPLDTTQPNHRLLQIDAATGSVLSLTDPAILPFKVANGDWSVSPDGSKVAFVSAIDRNIWVVDLQP